MVRIIANTIPASRDIELTQLGKVGGNMTGTQARDLLKAVCATTTGNQRTLCHAMEMLIYFRYRDVPVRFFLGRILVPKSLFLLW